MMFTQLADVLKVLEAEGIKLYATNLTKRKLGEDGQRRSVMDRLADRGLARFEPAQGPRGLWLVDDAALPELRQHAADARPGRPPGEKVTLTAEETQEFLSQVIATAAKSPAAVRQALMAATGWSVSQVGRAKLIGIRLTDEELP